MYLSLIDFRKRIEFSLCQQHASDDDVRIFCRDAAEVGVGVACVNPVNIPLTVKLLGGREIDISANVGFPFGSHLPEVKALEARRAVEAGATQIDMVINVGALRSQNDESGFRRYSTGRRGRPGVPGQDHYRNLGADGCGKTTRLSELLKKPAPPWSKRRPVFGPSI